MKNTYDYIVTIGSFTPNGKFYLSNPEYSYLLKQNNKIFAKNWKYLDGALGDIWGVDSKSKTSFSLLNSNFWIILRYKKGTEKRIGDNIVKVPYAWVEFWGSPEEVQNKFAKLTGKEYCLDFAIQKGGDTSIQVALDNSQQTAGFYSVQVLNNNGSQTSLDGSIQKSGNKSKQIGTRASIQVTKTSSTQIAEDESTQIGGYACEQQAGHRCVQIAKESSKQTAETDSIQFAFAKSAQSAGTGSISIICGKLGYCQHKGKVLQILSFFDSESMEHIFLSKIINDKKKHELEAIKTKDGWDIKDTIIQ